MELLQASLSELEEIVELTQESIRNTYPKYYTKEVVDFFLDLHSRKNIEKDIQSGTVYYVKVNDELIGTGTFQDNHIHRLYIASHHQRNGYGTFIMNEMEHQIAQHYEEAFLDSSLPACFLYEKNGYQSLEHCFHELANEKILVYEIMRKYLHQTTLKFNYDGKVFVPITNAENGEVDEQSIFTYHQKGTLFWAEYQGGHIQYGTMVGTVDEEGHIDFHYQHVNLQNEVRIGRCQSTPTIDSNGKIVLSEEWEWLNGDLSKGTSTLIER